MPTKVGAPDSGSMKPSGVCFLLFLFGCVPCALSETGKPSVVLITIDTVRADHLGAYGSKTAKTPNLDRLAAGSLFFENAVCAAPLTLPSHTSLMTGRYPYHHGVNDNAGSVNASETTLAEILKSNGYRTYAFVGGFPLDHRFGLNQGFDLYDDLFPRQKNRSLDFRSERSADAVVDSLLRTKLEEPYFVWVHFYDPHAPYLNGGYEGEIAFVDQQIGRLLQKFRGANPIIAVAGDHGESLGEHGEWTHRIFLYDATMRVPFWISGPGFRAQRVSSQVRLIDFLSTILQRLMIKPPAGIDGEVLPQNADLIAQMESYFPQLQLGWSPLRAVRTGQWKYIEAPKPELYDLVTDPQEKVNVLQKKADVAKKLKSILMHPRVATPAQQISPEVAEQLAALGYVSGNVKSDSSIDPKDQIQVWNQIEKAVDLELGKPDETIRILEQARKGDPENPMVLGFLAQKYAEANRLPEAKTILQAVLKKEPGNTLALYRMAVVCLESGQAKEAKDWAEALRKRDSGNPDAWILLAKANLRTGNQAAAAQNLQQALSIDPHDPDLRIDLGNIYLQLKKMNEGKAQFQQVLKESPGNLQALNGLATHAFLNGDFTSSEKYLVQASAMDRNDIQTKMNLALLYSKQGRIPEARKLYEEVMRTPGVPEAWKTDASTRLQQLPE